jgi:hypothetical protein
MFASSLLTPRIESMIPCAEPLAEPPDVLPLELLAAALRPLAQPACAYDGDGRCLFANNALARWLGRDEADLAGLSVFEMWPAGFAVREAADLRCAASGRLELLESRPGPWGPRPVRAVKYPWQVADGPPVIVVVFEESAPAGGPGRLEQLCWMVPGIVHDFNNYLTMLHAHKMKLESALEDCQQRLAQMGQLLDHACQLPRQLLAFARGEAPAKQPIDVHALLRSLEGLVCGRTGGLVTIEYRLDPAGVWIECDPVQLTQALMNLCCNGVDAMGGEGRLVFETRCEGGVALISIEDTGPGIPPEALSRIFEPMYTTRRGGSGLGLVVVREVVSRHGGRIGCISDPGRGARFVLEFPLLACSPSAERPANRGTVVVVDPEGDIGRLSATILEQGGYRVRRCTALDELAEPADWAIVCASLLSAEGVRRLEAWLAGGGAGLVVTTTGPEPALTPGCLERLRGVLCKPYSAEMLLKAVEADRAAARGQR